MCGFVIILSIAFLLNTPTVKGDSLIDSSKTTQGLIWIDESYNKTFSETDQGKVPKEVCFEFHQTSYEERITRLESFINIFINVTSSQAPPGGQTKFNSDLLNFLNRIVSKLETILSRHNTDTGSNGNGNNGNGNTNKDKTPVTEKPTPENEIPKFSNCAEAVTKTLKSGIYNITLYTIREPFPVYCEGDTINGIWTVIQRRQGGSVDFFRNWTEYKNGFGNLTTEFFIGLDKLHALTLEPQELLIELEDFENNTRYAKYNAFAIGGESEDYALNVLGTYSGNAGDSLINHKNRKFSTKDRDNDRSKDNCATKYKGAWWYNACHKSNLNGIHYRGHHDARSYGTGINWSKWRGFRYSYKRVQMLIRPKASQN